MGKLAILVYNHIGYLPQVRQGGVLFYSEDQLDAIKVALLEFQENKDTKAAILVFMAYSKGPVSSLMTISQLSKTDVINSLWSPSHFIMMRQILPECLTKSWQSPLSMAVYLQGHSMTLLKVWVVWSTLRAFG